jgi:Domain of unknown function (DUF4294)
MKFSLVFLVFASHCSMIWSQNDTYIILDTISTPEYTAVWYQKNGETEVTATHAQINVKSSYKHRRQKQAYSKLQKKVIKVYPYAKAAGDVMKQYEAMCAQLTDEKQKKYLLDQAEKQMKAQFEKDLRSMTVSEGVILIKLIDRQTGESSFELVRELKGKMSAYMWQGVAKLFGHNLKASYEAAGEDVWIENTIELIENGSIPVVLRDITPFQASK